MAERISLINKEKDKKIDHSVDKNYIKGTL